MREFSLKKQKKELTIPDLEYLKSFIRYGNELNEKKIKERLDEGGMEILFIKFDFNNIYYNNTLLKKINFKIKQLRKLNK